MKKNAHKSKRGHPMTLPATIAVWLLCAVFITLVVIYLQPGLFRASLSGILRTPSLIFLNLLPAVILIGVLYCILGNVFAGAAITATVLELLSYANLLKMEGRNDPLVPSDIALLRESLQAVGDYQLQLHPLYLVLIAGSILVLIALAVRYPSKKFRPSVRVAGAATLFVVFALSLLTIYPSKTYYENLPDVSKSNVPQVYNTYGFPYCFLHNLNLYPVDKPQNFQAKTVEQWEQETLPAAEPRVVNILFVMGEAFSDLSDEDGFTYAPEENPTYFYHLLADSEKAVSGHIVVSGFGAGTANTEFDVLTGMQTTMLSESTSSAFRVVHRDLDSLAQVYSRDGYSTSMLHPGQSWFYNRCSVYPHLGIDDLSFIDTFSAEDYNGSYVTDAAVGQRIREMIETQPAGENLFAYIITIENHQAYVYSKYASAPEVPVRTEANLSAEAEEQLAVYFQGVANGSAMIYELASYLDTLEDPFVLAFFGDHRPALGAEALAYREVGSPAAEESSPEATLYRYEVPYVIWCNDSFYSSFDFSASVQALELPPDHRISANYLGSLVYELTGQVGSDAYWDYLTQARRMLPVISNSVYELPDGSCTTTLPQEQTQVVEKLHWWEYYRLKVKASIS